MSYDAIVLKNGWDEFGISYGKTTTKVHIRVVRLQSFFRAFGSQMSGGISDILVEHIHICKSLIGINSREIKAVVVMSKTFSHQMSTRRVFIWHLEP